MDFDVVESGFNNADETINFGTRCFGDVTNLYETSTLASLRNSGDDNDGTETHINSFIKNGRVYFSINKTMRIFEEKDCSSIGAVTVFDEFIDVFTVTSDGRYHLLCLRNGLVHLLDSSMDNKCLFTENVMETNVKNKLTYVKCFEEMTNQDGSTSILIVGSTGKIIRLLMLSSEEDINVHHEEIYDFKEDIKIASYSFPDLFVVSTKTMVLNTIKMSVKKDFYFDIVDIYALSHSFLCLDGEGHLVRTCPRTLIRFPVLTNVLLKQFTGCCDENGNYHIVGVTLPNEEGISFIKSLVYPDMKEIFSIKLTTEVCLVQPESHLDETLYISHIRSNGILSELRIVQVSETEPEKRLERLIRKHKFDEAEKLVKLFNMDPVLISMAKAQLIVDKTVCTSEDADNLIKILDSIGDDLFRLNTCFSLAMNTFCANRNDVRRILNYGCLIVPKSNNEKDDMIQALQQSLTDLLFRFDTFIAVYTDNNTMDAWHAFLECDLIVELRNYIKQYKIEEAIILYSRFDENASKQVSVEFVEQILLDLNPLSMNSCRPFLSTFIPTTLVYQPAALGVFVDWLRDKIHHMEMRTTNEFPNNAIIFAESIMNLLTVDNNTSLVFQRQCTISKECLKDLTELMNALHGLQTLKSGYGIRIPLSNYLMGARATVKQLLDVIMPPDDYDVFLKEFLYKFMVRNQLEPNEIFLDKITDLMQYKEQYWTRLVGPILKYITSKDMKMEAVRIILNKARVPWNDSVRTIAHDALEYSADSMIADCIKNEPRRVVLTRAKYKIQEKDIDFQQHFGHLIKRIIHVNEPTMLEDVYELCTSSIERNKANYLLVWHFIRHGDLDKALSVLDDNTPEEIYNCAKMVTTSIALGINAPKLRDNFYHISEPIYKRLLRHIPDTEKASYEWELESLRCVYILNKTFDCNYSCNDIVHNSKKITIRNEIIDGMVLSMDGKVDIIQLITKCGKIASCLSLNKDEIILLVCEKLRNFDAIYQSANFTYEHDSSVKNLCLSAVLIFKYIGVSNVPILGDSFEDVDGDISVNTLEDSDTVDFVEGLRLAKKLIIKAMMRATGDEILACMEVMKWVDSCFYLARTEASELSTQLFSDHYVEKHTIPGYATFTSIRNLFEQYFRFAGTFKNPILRYLTYFDKHEPSTKDEMMDCILRQRETVESLGRYGHNLTSAQLMLTLQYGLSDDGSGGSYSNMTKTIGTILRTQCLPQLLQSVVSAPVIDVNLFYSILWMIDRNEAVKVIEKCLRLYKRQPSKLRVLAQIAMKFFKSAEIKINSNLIDAIINVKWWKKFPNCQIAYDTFFTINANLRLDQLISMGYVDEESIEEYCKDYSVDVQIYYLLYLKNVLLNWKPQYKFQTDVCRQKTLVLVNDENELLKKCNNVIDKITNKNTILKMVDEIWDKVNFYYYEVLICILNIISHIKNKVEGSNKKMMLTFLKNYKRYRSPCQNEIEQWCAVFPDLQTIDPLSEFRLPFSPSMFTGDIWNIIRPEVNLKTYQTWFEAIDVFKNNLTKDDICQFVIKEIVSSGILGKNSGEWVLSLKHEDLFAEVDECVKQITSLEKRTSAIYHLMINTPKGADRVAAAAMCFKYALEYKKSNPNSPDVEKPYIKVQKMYFSLSATHILHVYQLTKEKYMQLVAQPDELILALYLDERILKKAESINVDCPDINRAVDELGDFFDLNISKIRYDLLQNWLAEPQGIGSMDTSVMLMNNRQNMDTFIESDDNLKRAAYICTSGNIEFWQDRLFQLGMEDSSMEKPNFQYKARALKCLCAISDLDKLTELTDVSYEELMYYIDKLTLLGRLENLGITLDIENLDSYNKKELLKRISVERARPLAVSVMADICTIYRIEDLKYWRFIISTAAKLSMYSELKTYVDYLKNKKCQYKNFYISAWQLIIEHSFSVANCLGNEDMYRVYIKNVLMIQSCPVLYSINLENTLKICINAQMYEFAAILLPYIPKNIQKDYGQKIMDSANSVLSDLDKLNTHGICVSNVKHLLGSFI